MTAYPGGSQFNIAAHTKEVAGRCQRKWRKIWRDAAYKVNGNYPVRAKTINCLVTVVVTGEEGGVEFRTLRPLFVHTSSDFTDRIHRLNE